MMLLWLILLPMAGGAAAWAAARWSATAARIIALAATAGQFALACAVWADSGADLALNVDWAWVPNLGIRFSLFVDGLSLLLVMLTGLLGVQCVLASWRSIRQRVGFFHFNMLWTLAGVTGVFLARDLFLFYVFWEMMLIPLYFLIRVWGHQRRLYASLKFFIFTQAGGLFLLLGILGLHIVHAGQTGERTFDYLRLLHSHMPLPWAVLLMVAFLISFAVKLPAVPVHTWLPEAHTEAPTAGSVLLAGLVLKAGGYGMLRLAVPLFPAAAPHVAPVAMILGAIGIIYGAVLALGQSDLKRLVAYSSVSHMGFVMLGIFAWNELSLQGAVIVMLAHGLSTGAMFILVGMVDERLHTRDLGRLGGLWAATPRLGGVAMVLVTASLGLPGLAGFVGELLVLLGTFKVSAPLAAVAAGGLVLSAAYSLRIMQETFHGPRLDQRTLPDLTPREWATMAAMLAGLFWMGLWPQRFLDTSRPAVTQMQRSAAPGEGRP
ncbi:MAG: NADH-quinone oxidoreductase subunit M [Planctomycetaceae bacterium]|nr:NADH-quinone oxidoreductase subunit M [Planctomycetaceae bacterium]